MYYSNGLCHVSLYVICMCFVLCECFVLCVSCLIVSLTCVRSKILSKQPIYTWQIWFHYTVEMLTHKFVFKSFGKSGGNINDIRNDISQVVKMNTKLVNKKSLFIKIKKGLSKFKRNERQKTQANIKKIRKHWIQNYYSTITRLKNKDINSAFNRH